MLRYWQPADINVPDKRHPARHGDAQGSSTLLSREINGMTC